MGSKELLELVRKCPFVPLRIYMTDGRTIEIHHPDQIIVLKSVFVVPTGPTEFPDRTEFCSLLHIVRVEQLAPASAEAN